MQLSHQCHFRRPIAFEDVHAGSFPGPEHVYNMLPGEVDKLGEL